MKMKFSLFLLGLLCAPNVCSAGEPVVVFVSPESSIHDISLEQLRQIFRGEPVLISGKIMTGLNLPAADPTRQFFDQVILGLRPSEAARFWVDQRIRGQAKPPRTIPKLSLTLRLVNKLSTMISYGPRHAIPGMVRVISINGRKPDDDGYVLGG